MAYESFMAAFGTPRQDIENQMQEMVNEQFFVSSSYRNDIYQEKEFGSLEFKRIEARVTHLIDSATGLRVGDDFKKITFKDIHFKPMLGSRYKFDENIWLVYATDNINSPTSSCYVRRCNNTMNMLDRYGNIHREPCYIEYKPTKTSVGEYDSLTLPFTKQVMYCQLNKWTENIGINNRFMFGDDVFKISDRVRFNRTETFNEETLNTNRYYMDYDNLNEFDNLELKIADFKMPDWSIKVQPDLKGIIGDTGTLTAAVLLNDEAEEEGVLWYSSNEEIAIIDKATGEYQLLANGDAIFYAKLENNEYYYSEINVKVSDSSQDIYENVLIPETNYIKLNETVNYEIYEYKNGQRIDTTFEINVNQLPLKDYKFKIIDGNHFTITNLKQNTNTLLKLECTNVRDGSIKVEFIEMGGIF